MTIYENGKIYRIEPINGGDVGDVYYGSTTKKLLSQRFAQHKYQYRKWKEGNKNQTSSFILFDKYDFGGCQIVLVENVEKCESKNDLHAREKFYIKTNECVNKKIPLRTNKEYYTEKREEILEYHKQYYVENTEKVCEYQKKYRELNEKKVKEKKRLYSELNKEKLKEYKKQYAELNADKIKDYDKERYENAKLNKTDCPCGGVFHSRNKLIHFKSKKHQAFLCNV